MKRPKSAAADPAPSRVASEASHPAVPLAHRPLALMVSSILLLMWLGYLGYVAWQIHFRG